MKKFVCLLLVLMFSFGMVSTVRQEKVEAASIAIGYAVFKAGIAFTGFAAYASILYANGYHVAMNDLITGYANTYYDYANGVYIAKGNKINVLDKLNLATSSFLSGNDPLTFSELEALKKSVVADYPTIQTPDMIDVDLTVTSLNYNGINEGGFLHINSEYAGKYVKLRQSSTYTDYYVIIDFTNYGWYSSNGYMLPGIRIIEPSGLSYIYDRFERFFFTSNNLTTETVTLATKPYESSSSMTVYKTFLREGKQVVSDIYTTTKDSFSSYMADFVMPYPNYYGALSGLTDNYFDLENLMNTDEYLQREVTKLIENNQVVNDPNDLVAPVLNPDGLLEYPGFEAVPDIPDIPYSPTKEWFDNLFNKVASIPDLFIGGITDLWDNTLVPKLDNIRDSILEIPTKLDLIWEWIIDFPDLIYDFFVPSLPAISETWQPVTDLFNQKIFPVIQPFQNIGFYEEELQDISADIKIGQYQGNHKIIDYSYLKSVREPIKSVIRSFFWILIIFFNLDQVHRLIRNQSIVKTYIRKVDEPGGNK